MLLNNQLSIVLTLILKLFLWKADAHLRYFVNCISCNTSFWGEKRISKTWVKIYFENPLYIEIGQGLEFTVDVDLNSWSNAHLNGHYT